MSKEGERPTINIQQALKSAEEAINTMTIWWDDLLATLKMISAHQNRVAA
ncbi:hypothetical protein [Thiothrix caldifontis]|nr:hypothetical protein [Thiothrix caldifontis]